MMGMLVRKYSRVVQRKGASAQARSLLLRDASATPVENMAQIRPPMNPIMPTNAAEISGSILPYWRMTVSTQGRHTGIEHLSVEKTVEWGFFQRRAGGGEDEHAQGDPGE